MKLAKYAIKIILHMREKIKNKDQFHQPLI